MELFKDIYIFLEKNFFNSLTKILAGNVLFMRYLLTKPLAQLAATLITKDLSKNASLVSYDEIRAILHKTSLKPYQLGSF
jgi:hypothetical protein